jgi:2-oxoglutarate dehydrogenase E2 component (dihydrolipoamide succinyltransferase)
MKKTYELKTLQDGKQYLEMTDENGQDSIAIRSMVYLALSYDHRIIDGADASRFLVDVKNRLENADFLGNFGI